MACTSIHLHLILSFLNILFSYPLRYQRQTRQPALRPQMDLAAGRKGDPCSTQRLEIHLHGLRTFLFRPQNRTCVQTMLIMALPLDLIFIITKVAFLNSYTCWFPQQRLHDAVCLFVVLLQAKHAKLLKQPLNM